MPEKVLIVLQENSGQVPLPESVPAGLRGPIFAVIDALAETFEDIKNSLQAQGRYQIVELLTDASCRRAKLLHCLVKHSKAGRIIDLVILGHGNQEKLYLHGRDVLTGGVNGNIRKLLRDAQRMRCAKLNLRMVYMCNCYAATLNDDWVAIGAKVSVGSRLRDFMPEPMTTFFMHNWLTGQTAANAAHKAYQASIPFWTPLYPPTPRMKFKTITVQYPCPTLTNPLRMCSKEVQVPDGVELITHNNVVESELVVGGQGNIKF